MMRASLALASAVLMSFTLGPGPRAAERPADDPNTLILALDGIAYQHLVDARARGAFAGWPAPRPLVSTFPSMTNVGFVAILSPLGSERMQGYEVRHFDHDQNRVLGGNPMAHRRHAGAWRGLFDASTTNSWAKATSFLWPHHEARNEMDRIEKLVLEAPSARMLGLVGASDALAHLDGAEPTIRLLIEFSERIERLREEHLARYGRPLRVIVLSDHGNGGGKIRATGGAARALKDAGLRPSDKLKRPADVVLVSYGVCGYGALFLSLEHAETAARAMLGLTGVDIAAWITKAGEMRVLGRDSDALVRWDGTAPTRRLAYEPRAGDPLRLVAARSQLADAGRLDGDGFGSEVDWFEATASGDYPDPLARLVDGLEGRFVRNTATVLFSYAPGYALGIRSARTGAWLLGGKLEATHGGLDRVSSWGIYLRSDDDGHAGKPIRADAALAEWADAAELRAAFEAWQERAPLHGPRILR
jgi:hypothetical protein